MEIRRATKEDIASIVNITENDGYGRPLDPKSIEDYMKRGDAYFLLCDPHPVGVAKLAVNKKKGAELFIISVKVEFQNKGFGTLLLEYVEKEALKLGKTELYAHVRIHNEKAIKFYQKNGFRKIGIVNDLYAKGDIHFTFLKNFK